jgi:hypothetical protein
MRSRDLGVSLTSPTAFATLNPMTTPLIQPCRLRRYLPHRSDFGKSFRMLDIESTPSDCSKTAVVPCSKRIILSQIGTTSPSGNPLRNIVE